MKGRKKAIEGRESTGTEILYEASFVIDPASELGRQNYRLVKEWASGRKHRRFRSELELPISQSLAEVDKSGIYDRLAEAMKVEGGNRKPIGLALTITILAARPESGDLIADLINLFIRFVTQYPDGRGDSSSSIVKPDYRLRLSPEFEAHRSRLPKSDHERESEHRLSKNRFVSEERDELLAPTDEGRYGEDETSEQPAEAIGIVAEETQGQANQDVDLALKALFVGLPDAPKARLDAIVSLQRAFRREAADLLKPAINSLLKSPPETFAEKQELASALNHALRELGLAPREVSVMQPCSIVALQGGSGKTSWLKLQTRKPPQQKSRPSTELGEITLVEAVREEAFGRGRGQ